MPQNKENIGCGDFQHFLGRVEKGGSGNFQKITMTQVLPEDDGRSLRMIYVSPPLGCHWILWNQWHLWKNTQTDKVRRPVDLMLRIMSSGDIVWYRGSREADIHWCVTYYRAILPGTVAISRYHPESHLGPDHSPLGVCTFPPHYRRNVSFILVVTLSTWEGKSCLREVSETEINQSIDNRSSAT